MRWLIPIAIWTFALSCQASANAPCRQYGFEGSRFTVCEFDPAKEKLQLLWTDRSGKPLRSFPASERAMGADSRNVLFGMNAGMFEKDGTPLGLYVENGKEHRPLNDGVGDGNFYMKPNGVFAVDVTGAMKIETTEAFSKNPPSVQWATQSGPMLLINGSLAPQIAPDGPSKNLRNGVGLRNPREAFFAISEDEVSFGKLARFFRDEMGCKNALYFDGVVSSAWIPSIHRQDAGALLGPMFVVSSR